VCRESILGDQQRHRECETLRETLEQTSDDESDVVLRRSLDRNSNSTTEETDIDREFAPVTIRHPGSHGVADRATPGVDGVDEAEPDSRGLIHELPPLGQSEKPVHQGAVEPIGAGEEHE
jgi:hypothetical protein